MKKLANLLIILCLVPIHLFAQDLDCRFFEWSQTWRHNSSIILNGPAIPIATDTSGNSYFSGGFRDTISFGNIPLSTPYGAGIFITKTDATGHHIWATKAASAIQGVSDIQVADIKIDQEGNSFIIGKFTGNLIMFGSYSLYAPISQGYRGFFAQLNPQGAFVRAKDFDAIPAKFDMDTSGNIYIIGNFQDSISLDNFSFVSNGLGDFFIAKMDNGNQFIWAKQFGGLGNDFGIDISVDENGSSYSTGRYDGQINFGNTTLNSSQISCFITKLDSNGQVIWTNHINNVKSNGRGIVIDFAGNSYIIGCFSDTMQINGQTLTATELNTFIAKVDPQGEFIDAIHFNDKNEENFTVFRYNTQSQISINPNGSSIYISSLFQDSLTVNGVTYEVNPNQWHSYFAELNTDKLGLKWILAPKGNALFATCGISSDSKGNCYTTGYFNFDTLILGNDTFPGSPSILHTERYLTKIAGLNNSILISNDTLFAVQTNVNYQWLDCANNMAHIPGATSRSFYPTVDGQYAVFLSNDFCSATSACMGTTSIGAFNPLQKITIYPNPASSQVTITNLPLESSIHLYDISGRMLQTIFNKKDSSVQIPVKDFAGGIYFVEIVKDGARVFKKVILMRNK